MKNLIKIATIIIILFSNYLFAQTKEELQTQIYELWKTKDWEKAEKVLSDAIQLYPEDYKIYYNLACVNSLLNKKEEALGNLQKSIDLGYNDLPHIEIDPDLANIRGTEEYKQIISQLEKILQNSKNPLPALDSAQQKELSDYLITNYQTPEDYVISKFEDHDIVFLGEEHYIKQNLELIHKLIPKLYANGIYNLGIEFAKRKDQKLIDSLIYADNYDESLARKIMFRFSVWGYQEYVDIFKAAWEINRNLPENKRKFRVIGLSINPDWSLIKTKEDRNSPEIMKQVWRNDDPDVFMARTVMEEIIDKNEKGLIYAGSYHAFTKYKQPKYDISKNKFIEFVNKRMGNVIYDKIGDKAFNIYLHGHWINANGWSEPYVYPVDGVIDALMAELPTKYQYIGFDVMNSPFSKLKATTSYFKYGYDDFKLSDFCDGYIFLCPFSKMEGVEPIKDFLNKDNIEEAKQIHPSPFFRDPSISNEVKISIYNSSISPSGSESNIKWKYRMLK